MNLVEVLQGAHVALGLLQARLVLILCMIMTFGLFCWAMWLQTALAAIIAAAWGVSIFLPVLFAGRGGHDAQEAPQHPAPEA